MTKILKKILRRVALGAALGAVLTQALVYHWWGSFLFAGNGRPVAAFGVSFLAVFPDMALAFGSAEGAVLVQMVLGGLLGGVVALATMPFADDGRELILRSLAHYAMTVTSFTLLFVVCRWNWMPVIWVGLLTVLYLLIWIGRWIGWYMEVAQLRTLLGLDPGPSPLKWRETAAYLPFVLLLCCGVPLLLRGVEIMLGGRDFPLFTGMLYPFLLMPVAAFVAGVSLGKRQGVCILYPVACFLCALPLASWMMVFMLKIYVLLGCALAAVPALAGNLVGAGICKVKSKRQGFYNQEVRSMKKADSLWIVFAVLVLLVTCAVNIGGAWYGHPARWWELLATLGYVLFWSAFTRYAKMPGRATGFAAASLVGNLSSLVASGAGDFVLISIPAILLSPLSGIAMYGFRFWLDWEGTYMVGAILSALWLGWNLWRKRS